MIRRLSILGLVVIFGCGIPADTSIGTIEPPEGFFELDPVNPIDARDCEVLAFTQHPIWVFDGDQIVELRRCLPSPVFLGKVMEALIVGVTTSEAAEGLDSAIPLDTQVIRVSIEDQGIVVVELNDAFYDNIEGPQRIRATAQLVFTALDLAPNTVAVQFEKDGFPRFLPDENGEVASFALGSSDFASFLEAPEPSLDALQPTNPVPTTLGFNTPGPDSADS